MSLGIVVGGFALAQTKTFTWTNPTQNTDGTTYDAATEQAETRVYCGVDPATFTPESPAHPQSITPDVMAAGDAQTAARDFIPGTYPCFATAVSIYGYESGPIGQTNKKGPVGHFF